MSKHPQESFTPLVELRQRLVAAYSSRTENSHVVIDAPDLYEIIGVLQGMQSESTAPIIDMILFCPRCEAQHVDHADGVRGWTNPPHATHTCQHCGLLWRPSNANTNGVAILPIEEAKHVDRIAATWPRSHRTPSSAEATFSGTHDERHTGGIGGHEERMTIKETRLMTEAEKAVYWPTKPPAEQSDKQQRGRTQSAGIAPSEKQWEWPIKTVGTLVGNLQTLPAEMPFYTAYFVEIGGKRIARTTHPSLSRETVFDGRIQKFSADAASLVIWATAAPGEPDAFDVPAVQSASTSTAYQAVGYVKSLDGNTSTHYEPGRVPDGESMLYIVSRRK